MTRRQRAAAVVLACVAICFLTLDSAGGALAGAHSGARGVLGALYRGTDSVIGPTRRFLQGLPDAGSNRDEVQRLRRENAELNAQLAAQHDDATTAAQLAKLQISANSVKRSVIVGRVEAFGPGQGFDWTITVAAGSADGVAIDQSVTDGDGLIGRVLHADAHTSVILLAVDPGSGVGVRDQRNGQLALATGAGTSGFTVSPLDPAAQLAVGDRLQTGPAGATSFVPNLGVAVITSVHTSSTGAVTAQAKAIASPTSVDLIGIIASTSTGTSSAKALIPS